MENKQNTRLYSLIFPIWVMLLLPWSWFVILPVNLLIDSLVLLLIFRFSGLNGARKLYLSSVMRTWIFGTLSSLVGFLFMLSAFLINNASGGALSQVCEAITQNPFSNIFGFIWVLLAIAVSFICACFFGLKFIFCHKDFPESRRKITALSVAIVTAPYTLLIPTVWFK